MKPWLFYVISMGWLVVVFAGYFFVEISNVVQHEGLHAARCEAWGGEAKVTYDSFGLNGWTYCSDVDVEYYKENTLDEFSYSLKGIEVLLFFILVTIHLGLMLLLKHGGSKDERSNNGRYCCCAVCESDVCRLEFSRRKSL